MKTRNKLLSGLKKVLGVIVVVGALTGGISSTAQAEKSSVDYGLSQEVITTVPQVEQSSEPIDDKYFSTYV